MTSKVSLQLGFLTNTNKKVHITIPNPKSPIDATAVDAAMDLIVAKQPFVLTQGTIVSKIGANQVNTDTASVG